MEHLVPEQMFSTETAPAEGISAVKALAIAAAEGQKIYTITADNVEQALGNINLSAATEQEIRNAAYAGMEVTTHQYQINFNGWVGEGYIIINPETGAGAYKISGGENGSVLSAENLGNLKGFAFVWAIISRIFGLIDNSRYAGVLGFVVTLLQIVQNCSEESARDLIIGTTALTLGHL